jgi:UDP-N-acetylglucosamine 1-carboxyvinyltransferase
MDKIKIWGEAPIRGTIRISGAKNAALPIMTACLLTNDTLVLSNVPQLADISTMASLLIQLGVSISVDGSTVRGDKCGRIILLNAANIYNKTAPYDVVRKMRASVWVLGPLLARFGQASVSLPGGCAIGNRPIDLHLSALTSMGAEIVLKDGYINASVQGRLRGAEIHFDKVSVGATVNVLMAACLAEGRTVINNAAKEPEISDLITCLIAMGASIQGIGTSTLIIDGVKELHGASHNVIADRLEAGTYAVAAAITGGEVELLNIPLEIIDNISEKLIHSGIIVTPIPNGVHVKRESDIIKAVDITTQAYPGFPTDMQAQFMALMSLSNGASVISETIFENRFMHVPELTRMGANIMITGHTAMVRGVPSLSGAQVMATDLRASVSLVLAALAARGETVINRVYHLDRGYERLEDKLTACGAKIKRIP